jgi:serine/threonine-protein kinase
MAQPGVVAPQIVGRYALHEKIASGGMANVYIGRLAGAVGFMRTVAIKRLHPHLASDPEFATMFLDEARLAARIQHPNVVSTLDVVASKGELFLVMEYVEGESLSQLVRLSQANEIPMPVPVAVSIMSGVLQGLHAAHEALNDRGEPLGIVHRDVSPQNVMIGTDGVPRVLDFGVAKAIGNLHSTRQGEIKGKLRYMAPEQVLGGGDIDRLADVFAASVVLWEILTGKPLFGGTSDGETVRKILDMPVDPPSKYNSAVPFSLDDVVLRGLERDKKRRHRTAAEMAAALEEAVPAATPRKVGEWVAAAAGDRIKDRKAKVAAVEQFTPSTQRKAVQIDALRSDPPPPDRVEVPPIPTPQTFKVPALNEATPPAPRDSAQSVHEISVEELAHSGVPQKRSLLIPLVAVGAGLILTIGVVLVLTRKSHAPVTSGAATTATVSSATVASATAPPIVPPTPPVQSAAAVEPEPTASATPSSSFATKPAVQTSAPQAATSQPAVKKPPISTVGKPTPTNKPGNPSIYSRD